MSQQNNIIDSTKLNDLKRCPRFYFLRHILGWCPTNTGFDLLVGQAWHSAMATLLRAKQEGHTYQDAKEEALLVLSKVYYTIDSPPQTGAKTLLNCMNALEAYTETYINDDFTVIAIEIPGVVPITDKRVLHFRLDAIIATQDSIAVMDHKTSSRKSATGELRWYISTQVGAYLHFLHLYDTNVLASHTPAVIINEVTLAVPTRLKQDGTPYANSGEGTAFLRIPITRSAAAMQAWLDNTNHWLDYLDWNLSILDDDRPDLPTMKSFPCNDGSCSSYRGCMYINFCAFRTNPLRDIEPPLGFRKDFWNPLEVDNDT